eukprot:gene7727-901_t
MSNKRLLEELEGVGATVQFAEEAADDASPSYISAELQYPASFLRPGADKDQLDFVLREGLILFRAENVQDRPDPPFCLQPGCMNGPIERERMELLRDRLQMMQPGCMYGPIKRERMELLRDRLQMMVNETDQGLYTHNHNITGNYGESGGFNKFMESGLDRSYLPVWMQDLGYNTYHVGEFLNKFRGDNCPRGWNVFDALVDPQAKFFDVKHSVNCGPTLSYPEWRWHQTDFVEYQAIDYLKQGVASGKPFYLQVGPVAPHFDISSANDFCIPADRHKDLYQGLQPPASPNKDIPLPPETPIEHPTSYALWKAQKAYRTRAQCLAGVHELVVGLISELRDQGVLDNTYIIFTSDNGYHIGNHKLKQGKKMPYEEDVRVPLYIRGPGITKGQVSNYQAHMMDLPATQVELAGGTVPVEVDGISLPLQGLTKTATNLRESVMSELWRFPDPGARADYPLVGMPTELGNYRSLRMCTTYDALGRGLPGCDAPFKAGMHCYKYLLWCNNFIQLFDLKEDPHEIVNLAAQAPQKLLDRFNALLSVLATCRGGTCAEPYKLMHPAGTVSGLEDAMSAEHDELYAGLRRFKFLNCS